MHNTLIITMGWLSIFSFLGCGNRLKTDIQNIAHGPFKVQIEARHNKYFNINIGKMATHSYLSYTIFYRDKALEFSKNLQQNTGFSHLWKVYILEGAPGPTLIAGSQSLYLITEEDRQAVLRPLDEQSHDFAGLQMLDALNGQPAAYKEVYMGQPGESLDTIKGGDYLLVNQRVVLHIPDLTRYVFNENNYALDNYSNQSNSKGAIAFSPDKKWIVFPGGISWWSAEENKVDNKYAMLVYDYQGGTSYALPFDHTQTRLKDVSFMNQDWFDKYFEWVQENEQYRLQVRKYEVLPYWQGFFKDDGASFELSPVKASMQQVLATFFMEQLQLGKENILPGDEYSSDEINIKYGDLKFAIWYRPIEQELIFMKNIYAKEDPRYKQVLQQIGHAFNQELNKGKYQDEFTHY